MYRPKSGTCVKFILGVGGLILFDFEKVQGYMMKWQDILRLRDWDIKLEFVTNEWRKTGDVKIDQCAKAAIVLINNFNPYYDNVEARDYSRVIAYQIVRNGSNDRRIAKMCIRR